MRNASSAAAVNTVATREPLAPVPSRPRAAVSTLPPRSSSISASARRRSSLDAAWSAREHRGRDERDGQPVVGEQPGGACGLQQLVELPGAVVRGEPEQRDEDLGLQRSAERAGQQQPAHAGAETVHQVAELHQETGRRFVGQRHRPAAVGPGPFPERAEQPVDECRHAGGLLEHVVHQLRGRPVHAQQQCGPCRDPRAVERLQHHRRAGGGECAPERRAAGRPRPRPVRHHEMTAGCRGELREPLQVVRREQVGVVEQERVVDPELHEIGELPVDGDTGGRERGRERVQEYRLAVPARTDHVHPVRRGGAPSCLVHESTRRGRAREQHFRGPRRRLDTRRH